MTTETRVTDALEHAIQEARQWKMEAQTANATIAEIYRLVGSKAGNWNGAGPVRAALTAALPHMTEPKPAEPVAGGAVDALEVALETYNKAAYVWTKQSDPDEPRHRYAMREAIQAIAALRQQAVPELSDEDIAAAISDTDRALDALPDRFSVSEDDGKRIIVKAVAESIRARLIAPAQEGKS